VWLNDYRLACQLGGATTDEVIIRILPLHLTDLAQTWLEHLPASQIHNWDDLVCTFVGNFQGTYVRPGNSWDLCACTQKLGESLRDFIRRFSKHCTELPSVAQFEIVHTYLEGTTCQDLVCELGHSPPVESNELFDIANSFASGEEAVGAIFDGKKGKRVDDTPAEGSESKEPQQNHKRGKMARSRAARRARRDTTATETRPSQLTRLIRALEAPACSTTCSRSPAHTTRHRSTTPSSSATCSKSTTAAPPQKMVRPRRTA
jgi:hypothetical protein